MKDRIVAVGCASRFRRLSAGTLQESVSGESDDSGRGQPRGDFVFAGYVAPTQNWLIFGHAWQSVLDAPRKLTYLHTREAMRETPSGPCDGWSREECDAKIYQLIGVIHSFGFLSIRHSIPHRFYKPAFKGTIPNKRGRRFDNPFIVPFFSVAMGTLRALMRNGIMDKVNFIFDNESKEEQKWIIEAWHVYNKMMERLKEVRADYHVISEMIGDPPDFS